VTRPVHFEVRVRTGFLFQPPPGSGPPNVGALTGWLTLGLVHQLINLPPPPDPSEIVVYSWRADMTLSTETRYIRPIAEEPTPVADPFPDGISAIRLLGSHIDQDGNYTIVGSAKPVPFDAPPELVQFLFNTNVLTDVEMAIQETGVLLPGD
jgi:hypothetical protein